MKIETLANPPIREAIFTIVYKNEVRLNVLQAFSDLKSIRDIYRNRKNNLVVEHQIQRKNKKGTAETNLNIQELQDGYILQPSDSNPEKIIQARKELFSFHKIKGYSNWETLLEEFESVVRELIKASIEPIHVKEISVRYINHLPFDATWNLREYFNLLPAAIEGIPNNIKSLFLQVGTTRNELDAIITEAIIKVGQELKFVIDLKVSKQLDISLDDASLWDSFNEIREFKNDLFFSMITDKTKNLFQ